MDRARATHRRRRIAARALAWNSARLMVAHESPARGRLVAAVLAGTAVALLATHFWPAIGAAIGSLTWAGVGAGVLIAVLVAVGIAFPVVLCSRMWREFHQHRRLELVFAGLVAGAVLVFGVAMISAGVFLHYMLPAGPGFWAGAAVALLAGVVAMRAIPRHRDPPDASQIERRFLRLMRASGLR